MWFLTYAHKYSLLILYGRISDISHTYILSEKRQ